MSAATPSCASLLSLPPELLRLVWDALRPSGARAHDQHALRCACTQLRDATMPFITALRVHIDSEEMEIVEPQGATEEARMLREARRQLAAFPAAATSTSFSWTCWGENSNNGDITPFVCPELLPAFCLGARGRLAAVRTLTLRGNLVCSGTAGVRHCLCC
jgi:hypothetical protein